MLHDGISARARRPRRIGAVGFARVRQARAEIARLVPAEEFGLGVGIPTIIRLSTQEGTAGALPFRDFRGRAAQFATTSPVLLQSYTRCEG